MISGQLKESDARQFWFGSVPETWPVLRNKNAFVLTNKKVGSSWNDETLLSLTKGGVIVRDVLSGKGKFPASFEDYQIVRKSNVIFCLFDIDETPRTVGLSKHDGMITGAYNVFQCKDNIDPRFITYFYIAIDERKGLKPFYTGLRKVVRFDTFMNAPIPIPEKEIQKEIADFLDRETARIDQLIEKKTKFLSILEESVETKITSILTSGLKEGVQHQENKSCPSSEYPNHWKLLKLRHAGSCANGINISGDAFGSGTPFISYGDVYKNAQIPDTILGLVECSAEDKKRYSIKRGDVLFTRTSENIEDIGTASTCMTDVPDGVYAGFLIRFRPNPNVLLPEYSKFLFRNSTVRSFFSKEVMLVTRASLSQNLLKNLPLALPPLNEQIGLAKILLDIEASHVELTSKIKATILSLREYKSSIITAAVTGQIDVKSYGKSGAVDRHLDHLQDEGRA